MTPTQVDIGRTQRGNGRAAWLSPAAAASLARVDRALGRKVTCTWAGRSWAEQQVLWDRYGHDPMKAARPGTSPHESGNALDTDEWTIPGFVALMAEHGWKRTIKREPWHFVYSASRDKHRNDPTPTAHAPATLEDIVTAHVQLYLYTPNNNLLLVDHLNMTIRNLGNKPTFERDQFDHLPHTKIAEPLWTQMFRNFDYVTQPNLAPEVKR